MSEIDEADRDVYMSKKDQSRGGYDAVIVVAAFLSFRVATSPPRDGLTKNWVGPYRAGGPLGRSYAITDSGLLRCEPNALGYLIFACILHIWSWWKTYA
jgi:hypothetical protein